MIYEPYLFPDRLKALMKKRDLNAVQLGKKIELNPQTIRNYLGGLCVPNLTTLVKIAEALKTNVDYLCGGFEKQPLPEKKPRASSDPERGRGGIDDKRILIAYNTMMKAANELRPFVDKYREKL